MRRSAAAERNTLTFGSALTREQIDALSDDPEEMRRQLLEMAGGDALIRVDSFEGAALPAKSQIKSIHITRDQFAAENHNAGGLFIDIITQPGLGAIRGGGNFRLPQRLAERPQSVHADQGPREHQELRLQLRRQPDQESQLLLARRQRDAARTTRPT